MKKNHDPKKFVVSESATIRDAMAVIDAAGYGITCVVSNANNTVLGIVTDGDVRKKLLAGISLNDSIRSIANTRFTFLVEHQYSSSDVEHIFTTKPVITIPVLAKSNTLVDVIVKHEFYSECETVKKNINLPVVIMAGGEGKRMAPFTHILPKPLIPVHGVPVIEIIMQEFAGFGCSQFFVSVNTKARMIRAYFEGGEYPFAVEFVEEPIPLGTAGSLGLMRDRLKGDFFVSNADIIIRADYAEAYAFHQKNNNDLTIIGARRNHVIPYGVCTVDENGGLISITEKPQRDIIISTGMYIVHSRALDHVRTDRMYHITELIETLKNSGGKVGVFSVPQDGYLDVGQWDEFKKTLELFSA